MIPASAWARLTAAATSRTSASVPTSSGAKSRVTAIPSASRPPPDGAAALRVKIVACGLRTPSVPPDQTKAMRLATSSAEMPRRRAKRQRERQRREATREIVGAAVALGLADEGDDLGRIDRAGIDQPLQPGDVVGAVHQHLVHADAHVGSLPLAGACAAGRP